MTRMQQVQQTAGTPMIPSFIEEKNAYLVGGIGALYYVWVTSPNEKQMLALEYISSVSLLTN